MKVQYAVLNQPDFLESLDKLLAKEFPFELSYKIGRITKMIYSGIRDARLEYSAEVRKFADTDEAGNVIVDENQKPKISDEEKQKGFLLATKDFMGKEVSVGWGPILMSELRDVKIEPKILLALESIIQDDLSEKGDQDEKSN